MLDSVMATSSRALMLACSADRGRQDPPCRHELLIQVEKDFTTYGEEVKFGGGKVIRDGMGQGQLTNAEGAVDTVITNAVILDHWGIVKADSASRTAASLPSARRATLTFRAASAILRPTRRSLSAPAPM